MPVPFPLNWFAAALMTVEWSGPKYSRLSDSTKFALFVYIALVIYLYCIGLLPIYLFVVSLFAPLILRLYSRSRYFTHMAKFVSGAVDEKVKTKIKHQPDFKLIPYNNEWNDQFLAERKRIMTALSKSPLASSYLVDLTKSIPKSKFFFVHGHEPIGTIHIGSTSIKGIELSTPYHDTALPVTCDPFKLPKEFYSILEDLGYSGFQCAPHNPSGEDFWFFNTEISSPGRGFDIHLIGPKAHYWLYATLVFSRYLETNAEARKKYVDTKRPYEKLPEQVGQVEANKSFRAYKIGKTKVVPQLFDEAAIWAERT